MSDHRERYDAGELATTSGETPKHFDSPAPNPEIIETGTARGQHKDYWVLSESERAKGFVRPVRSSYKHVGIAGPRHPVRDLTEEEAADYDDCGYVKFETYPRDPAKYGSAVGRFWTREELSSVGKGCGTVTHMGRALSETYARDPHFYGATFCAGCKEHFPVGERGEFTWDGTTEKVGT